MEEEERKRKLLAGKEKLAAFQKKRGKKKKKKLSSVPDHDKTLTEDDIHGCENVCSSDSQSTYSYESDQFSITSGDDELNPDDSERVSQRSLLNTYAKLQRTTERVAELEEMLLGKQTALDKIVRENDQFRLERKSQEQTSKVPLLEEAVDNATCAIDMAEVRMVAVASITEEKEATPNHTDDDGDYPVETHYLADQVRELQQQLNEAGKALHLQVDQCQLSTEALSGAKSQMLFLSDKLNEKDLLLAKVIKKLTDKTESYTTLLSDYKDVKTNEYEARDLAKQLKSEIERLRMNNVSKSDNGSHRTRESQPEIATCGGVANSAVSVDYILRVEREKLESQFHKQLDEIKHRILAEKESEIENLKTNYVCVAEENQRLSLQLSESLGDESISETTERLYSENKNLCNSIEELKNRVNSNQCMVSEKDSEIGRLFERMQNDKDKIHELSERLFEYQSNSENANQKILVLDETCAKLKLEIQYFAEETQQLGDKCSQLKSNVQTLSEEKQQLHNKISGLTQELSRTDPHSIIVSQQGSPTECDISLSSQTEPMDVSVVTEPELLSPGECAYPSSSSEQAEVRGETMRLESAHYEHAQDKLEHDMLQMSARVLETEQLLQKLREDLDHSRFQLQETVTDLQHTVEKNGNLEKENTELSEKLISFEGEVDSLNCVNEALKVTVKEMDSSVESLMSENKRLDKCMRTGESELKNLQTDLDRLINENIVYKDELVNLTSENNELKQLKDTLEQEKWSAFDEAKSAKENVTILMLQVTDLSTEIDRINEELSNSKEDKQDCQLPGIDSLKAEMERLSQDKHAMEEFHQELIEKLEMSLKEKEQSEHEKEELTRARDILVDKVDKLTKSTVGLVMEQETGAENLKQQDEELQMEFDELVQEKETLILERDNALQEKYQLIEARDGVLRDNETLVSERDDILTEKYQLIDERDSSVSEITKLIIERDSVLHKNYQLLEERDRAIYDKSALIVERDDAIVMKCNLIKERDSAITDRDTALGRISVELDKQHMLNKKVEELSIEKDHIIEENQIFTQEKNNLERRLLELQDKIEGFQSENEQINIEQNNLLVDFKAITIERNSLAENCDKLVEERQNVNEEKEALVKENTKLKLEIDTVHKERDVIAMQRDEAIHLKEEILQKGDITVQEKAKLLDELINHTSKNAALIHDISEVKSQLLQYESRLNETLSEKEQLSHELEMACKERDEVSDQNQKLVQEKEALVLDHTAVSAANENLKMSHIGLVSETETILLEKANLVTAIDSLMKDLNCAIEEKEVLLREKEEHFAESGRYTEVNTSLLTELNTMRANLAEYHNETELMKKEHDVLVQENMLMQLEKDALVLERDEITVATDITVGDMKALTNEKSKALEDLAAVIEERNAILLEREMMSDNLSEALHNLETLTIQADNLIAERNQLSADKAKLLQDLQSFDSTDLELELKSVTVERDRARTELSIIAQEKEQLKHNDLASEEHIRLVQERDDLLKKLEDISLEKDHMKNKLENIDEDIPAVATEHVLMVTQQDIANEDKEQATNERNRLLNKLQTTQDDMNRMLEERKQNLDKYDALEQEKLDQVAQNIDLRAEIERLNDELERIHNEIPSDVTERTLVMTENSFTIEDNQLLKAINRKLLEEFKDVKLQMESVIAERDRIQSEMEIFSNKRNGFDDDSASVAEQSVRLVQDNKQLQDEIVFIKKERDLIISERTALFEEIKQLRQQLNVIDDDVPSLVAERAMMLSEKNITEEQRDVLVQENSGLHEQLSILNVARNSAMSERDTIQTEKDTLVLENNQLSKMVAHVKEELETVDEEVPSFITEQVLLLTERNEAIEQRNQLEQEKSNILEELKAVQKEYKTVIYDKNVLTVENEQLKNIANPAKHEQHAVDNKVPSIINEDVQLVTERADAVAQDNDLLGANETLLEELATVRNEKTNTVSERDRLVDRLNSVTLERDSVIVERDNLVVENERVVKESSELRNLSDHAKLELDAIDEEIPSVVAEHTLLLTEKDVSTEQRNQLEQENVNLIQELLTVKSENITVIAERAQLVNQLDAVTLERNLTISERDVLVAEKDAILSQYDQQSKISARDKIRLEAVDEDIASVVTEQVLLQTERDAALDQRNEFEQEKDGLLEQLKAAKTENDTVTAERHQLVEELEHIKLQMDTAISERDQYGRMADKANQEFQEADEEVPSLLIEQVLLQIERDVAIEQRNQLEVDKENLVDELKTVKGECNTIVSKNDKLKHEKGNLLENLKAVANENNDITSERDRIMEQLDSVQLERDSATGDNGILVKEYEQLKEELRAVAEEVPSLVTERVLLLTERDTAIDHSNQLERDKESLVDELKTAKNENNTITFEREKLAELHDSVILDRDSVIAERDVLVAEKDGLFKEIDKLNKMASCAKQELEDELASHMTDRVLLVTEKDAAIDQRDAFGQELESIREELKTVKNESNAIISGRDGLLKELEELTKTVHLATEKVKFTEKGTHQLLEEKEMLVNAMEQRSNEARTLHSEKVKLVNDLQNIRDEQELLKKSYSEEMELVIREKYTIEELMDSEKLKYESLFSEKDNIIVRHLSCLEDKDRYIDDLLSKLTHKANEIMEHCTELEIKNSEMMELNTRLEDVESLRKQLSDDLWSRDKLLDSVRAQVSHLSSELESKILEADMALAKLRNENSELVSEVDKIQILVKESFNEFCSVGDLGNLNLRESLQQICAHLEKERSEYEGCLVSKDDELGIAKSHLENANLEKDDLVVSANLLKHDVTKLTEELNAMRMMLEDEQVSRGAMEKEMELIQEKAIAESGYLVKQNEQLNGQVQILMQELDTLTNKYDEITQNDGSDANGTQYQEELNNLKATLQSKLAEIDVLQESLQTRPTADEFELLTKESSNLHEDNDRRKDENTQLRNEIDRMKTQLDMELTSFQQTMTEFVRRDDFEKIHLEKEQLMASLNNANVETTEVLKKNDILTQRNETLRKMNDFSNEEKEAQYTELTEKLHQESEKFVKCRVIIHELETTKDSLENQLSMVRTGKQQLEMETQDLTDKYKYESTMVSEMQSSNAELRRLLNSLEHDNFEASSRVSEFAEKCIKLEDQISDATEMSDVLETSLRKSEKVCADSNACLQEIEKKYSRVEQELIDTKEKLEYQEMYWKQSEDRCSQLESSLKESAKANEQIKAHRDIQDLKVHTLQQYKSIDLRCALEQVSLVSDSGEAEMPSEGDSKSISAPIASQSCNSSRENDEQHVTNLTLQNSSLLEEIENLRIEVDVLKQNKWKKGHRRVNSEGAYLPEEVIEMHRVGLRTSQERMDLTPLALSNGTFVSEMSPRPDETAHALTLVANKQAQLDFKATEMGENDTIIPAHFIDSSAESTLNLSPSMVSKSVEESEALVLNVCEQVATVSAAEFVPVHFIKTEYSSIDDDITSAVACSNGLTESHAKSEESAVVSSTTEGVPESGSNSSSPELGEVNQEIAILKKKHKKDLANREQYLKEMQEIEIKTLRIHLQVDHEKAMDELEKSLQQDYLQKLKAMKAEKERRFVEEFRKVRAELKVRTEIEHQLKNKLQMLKKTAGVTDGFEAEDRIVDIEEERYRDSFQHSGSPVVVTLHPETIIVHDHYQRELSTEDSGELEHLLDDFKADDSTVPSEGHFQRQRSYHDKDESEDGMQKNADKMGGSFQAEDWIISRTKTIEFGQNKDDKFYAEEIVADRVDNNHIGSFYPEVDHPQIAEVADAPGAFVQTAQDDMRIDVLYPDMDDADVKDGVNLSEQDNQAAKTHIAAHHFESHGLLKSASEPFSSQTGMTHSSPIPNQKVRRQLAQAETMCHSFEDRHGSRAHEIMHSLSEPRLVLNQLAPTSKTLSFNLNNEPVKQTNPWMGSAPSLMESVSNLGQFVAENVVSDSQPNLPRSDISFQRDMFFENQSHMLYIDTKHQETVSQYSDLVKQKLSPVSSLHEIVADNESIVTTEAFPSAADEGPDINHELEKLRKENEELAKAKDLLLQKIQISHEKQNQLEELISFFQQNNPSIDTSLNLSVQSDASPHPNTGDNVDNVIDGVVKSLSVSRESESQSSHDSIIQSRLAVSGDYKDERNIHDFDVFNTSESFSSQFTKTTIPESTRCEQVNRRNGKPESKMDPSSGEIPDSDDNDEFFDESFIQYVDPFSPKEKCFVIETVSVSDHETDSSCTETAKDLTDISEDVLKRERREKEMLKREVETLSKELQEYKNRLDVTFSDDSFLQENMEELRDLKEHVEILQRKVRKLEEKNIKLEAELARLTNRQSRSSNREISSEPVAVYSFKSVQTKSVVDDKTTITMQIDEKTSHSDISSTSSALVDDCFKSEYNESDDNDEVDDEPFTIDLQHFNLSDELIVLHKEMKETQDIYARENALLKEALDREQILKDKLSISASSSSSNLELPSPIKIPILCKMPRLSTDVVELRQKLAIAEETIHVLVKENRMWVRRVKEQENLVLGLREQIHKGKTGGSDFADLFTQQLVIMQNQRDDLIRKLENRQDSDITKVMDEKIMLEENLRREKALLSEKIFEKGMLEIDLQEMKSQLDKLVQQQKHLEEKLYDKDTAERTLMKQKRILEEDLCEIECKLHDRESALQFEKNQLLKELSEKSFALKTYEALSSSHHSLLASSIALSRSSSSRNSSVRGSTESLGFAIVDDSVLRSADEQHSVSFDHIEQMRREMDAKHKQAVDILRNQLEAEHVAKELSLQEHHAAHIAAVKAQQKQQVQF